METEVISDKELQLNMEMKQELNLLFLNKGYYMIPSNLSEYTIYFQLGNNMIHVIHVVTDHSKLNLSREQYSHVKDTIYRLFEDKGYHNIHILSLIITGDMEKAKEITAEDTFCWIVDPVSRRLVVYENQVIDFYGIRGQIEELLAKESIVKEYQEQGMDILEQKKKPIGNYPMITIGITILNVIIFLICTFTGELLYNGGALNAVQVIRNNEFYRMITSMFLHADIHHLCSNMVIFYFLGEIVEKNLGHVKYMILYFLSGLGGAVLSMSYSMMMHSNVDSVGASGAIFGVIGALLWLALVRKDNLEHITLGKVLFLIMYSLYSGFTGTHIDNAAHIGGLITGFLFTFGTRGVRNEN